MIGIFRLDTANYHTYYACFNDVSGLTRRADVQIAGVKVGWIDTVNLVDNGRRAQATLRVSRDYMLYGDAHGIVRQDGLLGRKYLEIIPGNPLLPAIASGGTLSTPSKDAASVDTIMTDVQEIAQSAKEVAHSFQETFGGGDGVQRLQEAIDGFNKAVKNVSSVASSLDGVVARNNEKFDAVLDDLQTFSHDLRQEFPGLSKEVREKVASVSKAVENATRPIAEVVQKINDGEGVIGQLVADKQVSCDVRNTIVSVKDYFEKIDRLKVVFDPHGETMYGTGNGLAFEDAKGYFNVRIHPTADYFYLLGLVATQYGDVGRATSHKRWFDNNGYEIKPEDITFENQRDRLRFAPIQEEVIRQQDQLLYNVQFGKIFNRLGVRAGVFDSTFGIGIDYNIPVDSDNFRWVATLEAFDFYGRNRIGDTRMHLKWLNKLFLSKNIYTVFGVDDFVSETNKNAFFGIGMRFADDDVKYLASRFSLNS